jgi:hypothetical protein
MTNEPNDEREMLVLRDQAGHYYVVPIDLFELMRVPDENASTVEQAMSGGEVSGFVIAPCDYPRLTSLSLNVTGLVRLRADASLSFGRWQPRGAVGPCF